MNASRWIALSDVVLDPSIYPRARAGVNDHHVNELVAAIRAGSVMPAITVEEDTYRVVDGWHRVSAARVIGEKRIAASVKRYASEADLFAEAMAANTAHGQGLTTQDKIHSALRAAELGVSDTTLAAALRTSIEHLRAIKPLYATVAEAHDAMPELRHVEPVTTPISELRQVEQRPLGEYTRKLALKRSVRHLEGQTISERQATALEGAPGQSYLLTVRQLIGAIEYGLLPDAGQHPTLWSELGRLRDLLEAADIPEPEG